MGIWILKAIYSGMKELLTKIITREGKSTPCPEPIMQVYETSRKTYLASDRKEPGDSAIKLSECFTCR
jgi:hypothetical protein